MNHRLNLFRMKAMILAAGLGTRLKPMTDRMPKALAPVGGTPMLEHILLKIKATGFISVVLNIHHFGEQIIDFMLSNNNFGLKVDISDERDCLLDTGGGIKRASRFLNGDEPFLVHNVDTFSNVDLKAMYRSHLESNALATLLTKPYRKTRQLLFDKSQRLCAWQNRETGEVKTHIPNFDPSNVQAYAFGGIHIISPQIFQYMDEWPAKFSIIDFYLSACTQHPIRLYTETDLQLIDVGKQSGLAEAEQFLRTKKN